LGDRLNRPKLARMHTSVNQRVNAGRQPTLANGAEIITKVGKINVNVRVDRFHGAFTHLDYG
jgi:hypothetical protein